MIGSIKICPDPQVNGPQHLREVTVDIGDIVGNDQAPPYVVPLTTDDVITDSPAPGLSDQFCKSQDGSYGYTPDGLASLRAGVHQTLDQAPLEDTLKSDLAPYLAQRPIEVSENDLQAQGKFIVTRALDEASIALWRKHTGDAIDPQQSAFRKITERPDAAGRKRYAIREEFIEKIPQDTLKDLLGSPKISSLARLQVARVQNEITRLQQQLVGQRALDALKAQRESAANGAFQFSYVKQGITLALGGAGGTLLAVAALRPRQTWDHVRSVVATVLAAMSRGGRGGGPGKPNDRVDEPPQIPDLRDVDASGDERSMDLGDDSSGALGDTAKAAAGATALAGIGYGLCVYFGLATAPVAVPAALGLFLYLRSGNKSNEGNGI